MSCFFGGEFLCFFLFSCLQADDNYIYFPCLKLKNMFVFFKHEAKM